VTDTVHAARVAVIIVNYNSGALLLRALEALSLQTFRDFRTVLVDNASTDTSADNIESRFPDVTVVRSRVNLGFAAGNNLGMLQAQDAEWIALLNPDAFPAPNWIESLLAAAGAHPEFSFFGCRMVSADQPDILDGTGDIYHSSGAAWRRDHGLPVLQGAQASGEIFGCCAAAAMYRRDAIMEVGGFDERFFCYLEDVDLAFRLRLRGQRCLYVSEAVVDHVGSAISGRRSDFKTYHEHRNLVWLFVKNMPPSLFWRYLALHVALNLATIGVFAARGRLRIILRAKLDALRGLPALLAERKRVQAGRKVASREIDRAIAHGLSLLWRVSTSRVAKW